MENEMGDLMSGSNDSSISHPPDAIVFIDGGLPDIDTLRAAAGPSAEVQLLEPAGDGPGQMAAALAGRRGLSAIHLLTHGATGRLDIGGTVLDASTLPRHRHSLAALGQALAPGGDLLLYGCRVGQGEPGRRFIEALAQASGAAVAAAAGPVGGAAAGGSWQLPVRTGDIQTTALSAPGYAAVLESPDLPADTSTAGVLPFSGTVTGTINPAFDLDWYRVTLTGGVRYRIDQQTLIGSAAPLSDTYLRLHDAAGTLLSFNDDSNGTLNSQLFRTPAVTAVFYVSAGAFSGTGDYALRLSRVANGSSGDDALTGSGDNDVLGGGAGDDILTGGAGDDAIEGGAGTDTVVFSGNRAQYAIGYDPVLGRFSVRDTAAGGDGTDAVSGVEWFTFADGTLDAGSLFAIIGTASADSLVGSTGNDDLRGLEGNDTLLGLAGHDTLDGGPGDDSMVGGTGNDTYIVDDLADLTVEAASAGTDTVVASLTWTLRSNTERLALSGTALNGTGNSLANVLTGNGQANVLRGFSNNDTLVGGAGSDTLDGGSGGDWMSGGGGNDFYYVDHAADRVVEAVGGGYDKVYVYRDWAMAPEVESLTLMGTGPLAGIGNALPNMMVGNSGANTFHGLDGDDTIYAGDGSDTLYGGSGNDDLRGQAGNDILFGGAGTDTMSGGPGNDTYYVDVASDVAVERAVSGNDKVVASVDWVLGEELERLELSGTAVRGTGNALANTIIGSVGANLLSGLDGGDTIYAGSGSDTLDGGDGADLLSGQDGDDTLIGGAGNDTLRGGSGADQLRFVTPGEGVDRIEDFSSVAGDKILVVAANFGLVAGAEATLVVNGLPTTGAGTFIYTSASGLLQFDRDGNGTAHTAVSLATLVTSPPSLVPQDIVLGT